jgi:hypothetical protein
MIWLLLARPSNWDEKAREITGGRGLDYVVEIGGPGTIAMSLKALAVGGVTDRAVSATRPASRALYIVSSLG